MPSAQLVPLAAKLRSREMVVSAVVPASSSFRCDTPTDRPMRSAFPLPRCFLSESVEPEYVPSVKLGWTENWTDHEPAASASGAGPSSAHVAAEGSSGTADAASRATTEIHRTTQGVSIEVSFRGSGARACINDANVAAAPTSLKS